MAVVDKRSRDVSTVYSSMLDVEPIKLFYWKDHAEKASYPEDEVVRVEIRKVKKCKKKK